MTVLKLIDTIKGIKNGGFPIFLGLWYGLALPIASLFLKQAAENQTTFLFVSDPNLVEKIFWTLTTFTVGVSLSKVFSFLREAYDNWFFALLACAGFEAAFIAVDNVYCTGFFVIIVSIANILQAIAGFLASGDGEKKEKISMDKIIDTEKINEKIKEEINKISATPKNEPSDVKIPTIPDEQRPHNDIIISPDSPENEEPVRFWSPEKA